MPRGPSAVGDIEAWIAQKESSQQILLFCKLGFNQNCYTNTVILLTKIIMCSKFPRTKFTDLGVEKRSVAGGATRALSGGRHRGTGAQRLHAGQHGPVRPYWTMLARRAAAGTSWHSPRKGPPQDRVPRSARLGTPQSYPVLSHVLRHVLSQSARRQSHGCT